MKIVTCIFFQGVAQCHLPDHWVVLGPIMRDHQTCCWKARFTTSISRHATPPTMATCTTTSNTRWLTNNTHHGSYFTIYNSYIEIYGCLECVAEVIDVGYYDTLNLFWNLKYRRLLRIKQTLHANKAFLRLLYLYNFRK